MVQLPEGWAVYIYVSICTRRGNRVKRARRKSQCTLVAYKRSEGLSTYQQSVTSWRNEGSLFVERKGNYLKQLLLLFLLQLLILLVFLVGFGIDIGLALDRLSSMRTVVTKGPRVL